MNSRGVPVYVWGLLLALALIWLLRTVGSNVAERIKRFARAIAVAEGYGVPGAIPTVYNNPGNIKTDGRTITRFASIDQGWQALYDLIQRTVDGRSRFYSLDMSIREFGYMYVFGLRNPTTSDRDDWPRNVARVLGVSVETRLRDILT